MSTAARLLGQLAGLGVVPAAVISISSSVSWVIISIINGEPLGWADSGRVVLFGLLSWVLLTTFALLGMLTGIRSKQETTALLVPFVIWSAVAFVPAITGPLSVTEQFKRASSIILQNTTVTGDATSSILIRPAFLAVMTVIVLATPRHRMRSGLNE